MSVINRMLRDLDARAARTPQPLDTLSAHAAPGPRPARWRLPAIVALGGVAIAVAAFADFSPRATRPVGPARELAPAPAVPAEPTRQADAPAPASASALAPAASQALPAAPPSGEPLLALAAPRLGTPMPGDAQAAPDAALPAAAPAAAPLEALIARAAPAPLLATPPRIDKRSVPPSDTQRAAAALSEAMDLARAGQRQAALQRALQALAIEPRHAGARQLAAVLQHESGASAQALALLREGATMDAPPPALTLLLARLLAAQGLADEALAVLERHALHSADAEGLRAGLLAQQGQYARALPAYENATRQQPGNPMWWFGLAVALDSEGQGPRARQAYTLAHQLGLPREDLATYAEQRLRALD
ncbi:MAG: tetratricopeptide repeat protein [Rubrivivax sp.]|nr:tetratricopeptide repeat protein [Rubrivivax sp.]